jgi:hypothetical protein
MGRVTDYLTALLVRQIAEHSVVVWYDPERHYLAVVEGLSIGDVSVAVYEGSFYALRRRVEPLLDGEEPPRLLVYVPLDRGETDHALVELESLGVVLAPGGNSLLRNTRLSVVARHALREALSSEELASLERQVEDGQLALADLERLGDEGRGRGVIAAIFGTGVIQEIALMLLGSERHDEAIAARKALPELAGFLAEELDVALPSESPLSELCARLAQHLLVTDLTTTAAAELPSSVSTIEMPSDPEIRERCVQIARNWRLRRDLRESYLTRACEVAAELGLTQVDDAVVDELVDAALEGGHSPLSETFRALEEGYQRAVAQRLLALAGTALPAVADLRRLVDLTQSRLGCFWSEVVPDLQARWALVASAATVVLEAARVGAELAAGPSTAAAIFDAYTRSQKPWSELDTAYRHMERRYHRLDTPGGEVSERLELIVVRARERYIREASAVAEAFVRACGAGRFTIPGSLRQRDVFEKAVKPALAEGKTAYVWVDALRYEMARELGMGLASDFEVDLRPAFAAAPTITEIGMACLLPTAGEPLGIVVTARGKLAVTVGGQQLKDRKSRVAYLTAHAGCRVHDAKLADFGPNPRKKLRDAAARAELMLVTSQEIDQLCEEDNVPLARKTMDDVLFELSRLFRLLVELGVKSIVVAADHGYLFGDELSSDMKISPPGGDTADLHRRVWVGRGGAASDSYLRARLDDFGFEGDLELATPWGFGCFTVQGGAKAYFHGGLSPQEVIVPVMTLKPRRAVSSAQLTEVKWTIVPGSEKISTRFVSVQVRGLASGMFSLEAPTVRLEIRAGRDVLSRPVSASYGFDEATGAVKLKLSTAKHTEIEPDTVALMFTGDVTPRTVRIHLLDARSGAELAQRSIEVAIAM